MLFYVPMDYSFENGIVTVTPSADFMTVWLPLPRLFCRIQPYRDSIEMTSFEECVLFIGLTSNEILTDEVIKAKSWARFIYKTNGSIVYKQRVSAMIAV